MELIVDKSEKLINHFPSDLEKGIEKAIKEVAKFQKQNNRLFHQDDEIVESYEKKKAKQRLDDLSLNERRRIKRAINLFLMKRSMRSANRLLHILYKNGFYAKRVELKYNAKKTAIMKARKEYVNARRQMLIALEAYKDEKGDYYKSLLSEGLRIQ